MRDLTREYRVRPGTTVRLADQDAADTAGHTEAASEAKLAKNCQRLADMQTRLIAEEEQALLVVLQGMDTGGKDETIRDVLRLVNPAHCVVTSFKKATAQEDRHDFLWRFHHKVPEFGEMGVFNRSYYEIVLGALVNGATPPDCLAQRYEEINEFERYLARNRIRVVKFLFHISKDEQKRRLQRRIDDPEKRWELSESDFEERPKWDRYVEAFEGTLAHCSTDEAPWHLVPGNVEWFRNLVVSEVLLAILEEMNPQFPEPSFDVSKFKLED